MEQQKSSPSSPSQDGASREELEQYLRARAWKDDTFRQELLADPKAVLQRDCAAWFPDGIIPSELSIKVIEEEEQSICFVLPPKATDAPHGLGVIDDEELYAVSGGGTQRTCEANCSWACTHYDTCYPCMGRSSSPRRIHL